MAVRMYKFAAPRSTSGRIAISASRFARYGKLLLLILALRSLQHALNDLRRRWPLAFADLEEVILSHSPAGRGRFGNMGGSEPPWLGSPPVVTSRDESVDQVAVASGCGAPPRRQAHTSITVAASSAASTRLARRWVRSSVMSRPSIPPAPAHSAWVRSATTITIAATSRLPVRAGSQGGRNVEMAPSAKIHALGLIAWNAAAWRSPSGCAASARARSPSAGDLIRQIEQVQGGANLHGHACLRECREELAKPGRHHQRHRPDPECSADDVAERGAKPEGRARRPKQHGVGPGRDRDDEGEASQREERTHGAGSLSRRPPERLVRSCGGRPAQHSRDPCLEAAPSRRP